MVEEIEQIILITLLFVHGQLSNVTLIQRVCQPDGNWSSASRYLATD